MRTVSWFLAVVSLIGMRGCGYAQAAAPPATVQEALVSLSSRAAVIFAGRVVQVTRQDSAGYVDVRFRVEQPVKGCGNNGFYVLREWAGLWSGQAERYSAGARMLMLLTARGPSGMSAPVDGGDGAIPLLGATAAPVMGGGGVIAADGDTPYTVRVDLRWLRTRVLRTAGDGSVGGRVHALDSAAVPMTSLLPGPLSGQDWVGPAPAMPPVSTAAGWTAESEPGLTEIVELLMGVPVDSHLAR